MCVGEKIEALKLEVLARRHTQRAPNPEATSTYASDDAMLRG